ncbi:sulfotransferase [Nocardioides baekrokdamisoli]|uniref:Sulfotransferase n=1 Tax=Nocardioides baekrokdamisoli TaxID=1804624 RepID=A0A3G9IJP9_9ACTN|nr:sulfotransferase [Nocardioides baekrokdamisoli]BBH18516.1 sulfotransferase [Nocardioides baekrokdamisoli]
MTDTSARTRPDLGTYEEISAAAVGTTGLTDFGGTEHEEGLRILVDDLAENAGLTPLGNYQQRQMVKATLVSRLLSQQGFTANPEHADVRIERPIFVTGLPRTGTTALHRLLTADPSHQGLELWLTEVPQPRPPRESWATDPIYQALDAAYKAHHEANPDFSGIHYSDAATVEECWRLLRQSGLSVGFESLADIPRYAAWLEQQDWTPAYARHKQNLQLIGLHDQDKRWVLKNPSHLVGIDAILSVYPDACIVRTTRDVVASVASACSLSAAATDGWSTTFVGARIGETQLDLLDREVRAYERDRARHDASHFLDVDYDSFIADPVGTTRGIYEAFDLDWSPAVDQAVTAADAESRTGARKSSHRYDLADYGLTETQVRDRLA